MSYTSPDLPNAIWEGKELIEVRTGSDSDFPKIQPVLDGLKAQNIPYILRILSAHRTPEDMAQAAQDFPNIALPPSIQWALSLGNARVKLCIAAAWWSAHIAGMTASETQTPVIALPVPSTSSGLIDASFSMINMPPGIPNGFVPNNESALNLATKLYNLELPSNFNLITLNGVHLSQAEIDLISQLGLDICWDDNTSPIVLVYELLAGLDTKVNPEDVNIFIPAISEKDRLWPDGRMRQRIMRDDGTYMWIQKQHAEKYTNAILYAAQLIAMFNPSVKQKLDEYRQGLQDQVRQKELELYISQVLTPRKKELFDSWLWPKEKTMTLEKGDEELEKLWYELFYRWKNADLYIVPNTDPIQVLMLRSDRTSVFDIKLDLEIEGKGEIQTQISKLWAKFAEDRWMQTCFTDLPSNIPEELQDRCQTMELCKPLTMEVDGEEKGLELIFRNYNAGSLFNKFYKKGIENPYGVELPEGMEEWEKFPEPIFTPTTKDAQDTPVNSDMVRERFPDLIAKLEKLFAEFTAFIYERGYVVVDTKVEVFLNAQGEPVLGDEIFTPESSRFIKVEDFEAGRFISADKQIIRNLWKEFGWEKRLQEIIDDNPNADRFLKVSHEVTPDKRKELLDWYGDIHRAMAA